MLTKIQFMSKKFPPGVATGNLVMNIFKYAKKNCIAIPAINITGFNMINAIIETAAEINVPVIIQISNLGAAFNIGKGLNNKNQYSSILGSIYTAKYIHQVSKAYRVTVILHTDHCNNEKILWIKKLLKENKKHFKLFNKTLFSSHMLDFSNEPIKNNIKMCKYYFSLMNEMNMTLEVEIGITGGEEEGINNMKINYDKFYTKPKEVAYVYNNLKKISSNFIIAATFGNVHGVYKSHFINLKPKILYKSQKYINKKFNIKQKKPVFFVFHGGSGSNLKKLKESIKYGVVKINLDTDMQYYFTCGVRNYMEYKKKFLKNQIGNPKGKNKPNKKYYSPRIWLRKGEKEFKINLKKIFKKFKY